MRWTSMQPGAAKPAGGTEMPDGIAPAGERLFREGIAGWVHDIRNPLVSVKGYAKMVLEERAGPLNETQKEYLSIVAQNMGRMVGLLNELSEMVASEPPALEVLDARDLAEQCLRACRPEMTSRGVTAAEGLPEEPVLVRGDGERLRHLMGELITAAVQAAEPGGTIEAELTRWEGEEVHLTIALRAAPEGPGCEPRPEVFQSAMSKAQPMARLHGGRITATKGGGGLVLSLPALS